MNRYAYPDQSATAQMLTDLTRSLAAEFDVVVVASGQLYEDASARLASDETSDGVRIVRVDGTRFGRGRLLGRAFDYLSFIWRSRGAVRRVVGPTDVVVAMTDPPLLGVAIDGPIRKARARAVHWLQDVYPEVAVALGVFRPRALLVRWLSWWRRRALGRADAVVVVGERMRTRAMEAGVPGDRVRVVPNWADTAAIVPVAREANPLRTQWGLGDRFVVGYSGNLGRAHEFSGLLAAAEQLRDRKDLVFLLIGAGAQAAGLREAVENRRLENVVLKPYQPREALAESLSVPDVHVVSLKPELEGLVVPSKLYGAVAAGRPVLFLGERDGEVARFVARHRCGVTVAADDAAAIAGAIVEMAENPEACADMGLRARSAAETEGSRTVAVAKWKAVLDGLTEGRSG